MKIKIELIVEPRYNFLAQWHGENIKGILEQTGCYKIEIVGAKKNE